MSEPKIIYAINNSDGFKLERHAAPSDRNHPNKSDGLDNARKVRFGEIARRGLAKQKAERCWCCFDGAIAHPNVVIFEKAANALELTHIECENLAG